MKLKKYRIFSIFLAFVLVLSIGGSIKAADPTTGSLTIITHEQQNGDTTTNPPLKGVEYTVYKVDETCEDEYDAAGYIEDNNVQGISKTTGEDGTVVFDNLELGRYFVDVTSVSDGILYDENYSDFLVDIPMTNAEGTGWDYDIIVNPKHQTAFGNLELTKVDLEGNPIEGVIFKVQVMKGVLEYSIEDIEENVWTDYIPENSNKVLTLTTDENGKIYLNNLPSYKKDYSGARTDYVIYRLIEISAPDGYIVNNGILSQVYIGIAEDGRVELINCQEYIGSYFEDYVINDNLTTVTYVNEKPEIVKKVKNSAGNFVDSASAFMTNIVTFNITTDVPMQIADMSTYKITDNIPEGLILDRDSIVIEGTTTTGREVIPEDMYTLSQDGLEVTFDTSKMYNSSSNEKTPLYDAIIITYDTTLDEDKAVIGGNGNINTATLEYTNNIDYEYDEYGEPVAPIEISTTTVSDTAEVHTGAISLEKVEKGNLNKKLQGAKFKVATTKDNAENGIFVKDSTGTDIEVTTDEQGQAVIKGLAYADDGSDVSYWLVETQAPTYEDYDGITKYYNLLKSPVEVKVGKTTHEEIVQIQNSKGFDLPATGGIGIAIFAIAGITIMTISVVVNKKQKLQ